jgi:hypothetical protein
MLQYKILEIEIMAVGICRTDHATPLYPQKLLLTSPTSSDRLVGIVHSQTKAMELVIKIFQFFHSVANNNNK